MSATTVPINPVPKICCSTGAKNRLVPYCAELAAGLPTPPLTAEMVSGQGIYVLNGHAQVVESDGHDVTQPCVLAALLALKTAQSQGCRFAIMTDGSPTYGSQNVYDGASSGVKVPGEGVAAALLRQYGIENPGVLGSIPSPGSTI